MSRSFRKTPILKGGRRVSNRPFAERAHRDFRRKEKEALRHDPDEMICPTHLREVSEIWCSYQEHKWKRFVEYSQYNDIDHLATVYPNFTEDRIAQQMRWMFLSNIHFWCK